jgi:2-dehydropantoate 2-reductase
MARVAVVGVGAIGGVVAALLQATGRHEITLCTRRPMDGLTVHTPDGAVPVRATNVTGPAHAKTADWVLVATKTYDAKGRHSGYLRSAKGAPRWQSCGTAWSIERGSRMT